MILVIAAGIRLIHELLQPVMPYLVVGVITFTVFRVVSWYRGRW